MGDFFTGIFKQAACGIWSAYPKINRVSLYCGIRFFLFFCFRQVIYCLSSIHPSTREDGPLYSQRKGDSYA